MRYEEFTIEGRNAVLEAFRAGRPIDKLFVQDGCKDGPVQTIVREARKHDTVIQFVARERLDQMSDTGKHQGVIAYAAAYEYAEVEDILKLAEERANRRLSSCLTESKIRTTSEQSSVPQTLPEHTESSFRSTAQAV